MGAGYTRRLRYNNDVRFHRKFIEKVFYAALPQLTKNYSVRLRRKLEKYFPATMYVFLF
jgi:hypothetical protein